MHNDVILNIKAEEKFFIGQVQIIRFSLWRKLKKNLKKKMVSFKAYAVQICFFFQHTCFQPCILLRLPTVWLAAIASCDDNTIFLSGPEFNTGVQLWPGKFWFEFETYFKNEGQS